MRIAARPDLLAGRLDLDDTALGQRDRPKQLEAGERVLQIHVRPPGVVARRTKVRPEASWKNRFFELSSEESQGPGLEPFFFCDEDGDVRNAVFVEATVNTAVGRIGSLNAGRSAKTPPEVRARSRRVLLAVFILLIFGAIVGAVQA
jgi:hypothetical protein